jgi:hypothetical protein
LIIIANGDTYARTQCSQRIRSLARSSQYV